MTTQSARIHTWGCDRHKEDTYEGCASCDLEDFSELSSKLAAAHARITELEKALRPFADAAHRAQRYADERQAAFNNPVDQRDWFMWQAARSLCVDNFKTALALMGS